MKRGRMCEYANISGLRPIDMAILTTPGSMQRCKFPLGQHDFRFYMSAGGPMLAQWQCPSFWLNMLPMASETSSAINYALLSVSICTQKCVNVSVEASELVARRGDIYYGRACLMLRQRSHATLEEALNTSLVLQGYDLFAGRPMQTLIHANAAVKLFQSLENSDTPYGPTALSRTSRSSLLEVAEAFFHDMHFPIRNSDFLHMLERRAQPRNETVSARNATDGMEQPQPGENSFAELATPTQINSLFWVIMAAGSRQALLIIQQVLDQCAYKCAHEPLPRSTKHEVFNNQVSILQLFCQMHLSGFPAQTHKENDLRMSQVLDLVQANMWLISSKDVLSQSDEQGAVDSGLGQQGVHDYLGILALIGQHALDHSIRSRAYGQIMFRGIP